VHLFGTDLHGPHHPRQRERGDGAQISVVVWKSFMMVTWSRMLPCVEAGITEAPIFPRRNETQARR